MPSRPHIHYVSQSRRITGIDDATIDQSPILSAFTRQDVISLRVRSMANNVIQVQPNFRTHSEFDES